MKAILLAASVTLLAAPAFADRQIEVEMEYDLTNVQTEADVAELTASLEAQARKACTYEAPITRAPRTDLVCVDEAVSGAIEAIAPQVRADLDLASAAGFKAGQ